MSRSVWNPIHWLIGHEPLTTNNIKRNFRYRIRKKRQLKKHIKMAGPKPSDYVWNGQRITHYVNHADEWHVAPSYLPPWPWLEHRSN